MANPNPLENPEAFHSAIVAANVWPGDVLMGDEAAIDRTWKEEKASGSSGAGITFDGEGLAEFPVVFRAWNVEHFRAWDEVFFPLLLAAPEGKNAKALDFYSAKTAPLNIASVVVKKLPAMSTLDDKGLWGWKVVFKQYREPKPAGGKPNGSKSDGGGAVRDGQGDPGDGEGSEPKDPADQMIEDLTKELEQESAGG